uniref:Uncharacterized protein n=1 Tax=Podoviridae sp. ctZ5d16 TaxID=2825257 RepID=A0A8S5Q9U7_9CAUD|nr:MAG TPA: hypothetical protein [Podoviridae sp. ctZ5d16]
MKRRAFSHTFFLFPLDWRRPVLFCTFLQKYHTIYH